MGLKKLIINPGDKFNKLEVVCEVESKRLPCGQPNRMVLCRCNECGGLTTVRLLHLVRFRLKTCGCIKGDKSGDSGKRGLYRVWTGIRNRCKSNYFEHHLYYDKGITVCKEWQKSYLRFKMWALDNGYQKGLQIDREDNSQGYYPANCRFVTSIVNANNKDTTYFIIYKGIKRPLMDVLREADKVDKYATIKGRLDRGMEHNKAIDTEIRKGNYSRTNFKNNKELSKVNTLAGRK